MSASSDAELLKRLVDFEFGLKRDSSEHVEEFDWGRLIHNPRTGAIWSDNYLEVHSRDLGAEALAALADQLLGSRGLEHRLVAPVDAAYGERLVRGFEALDGWEIGRQLYMVLRREPDRDAGPAEEVPGSAVEAVLRAVAEHDPDFTHEASEQAFLRDARLAAAGNGRWFAASSNAEPEAACVLFERDGIGQVETVGTIPEARGGGLASAVVLAATEASHRAGHDLTFIVADADDWPWKLYERLGFDRVGEHRDCLRKPAQLRESP